MKTLRIVVFVGLLSIISMIAGTAAWATTDTSVQLPPEASDNWWATVQKNIRESEYHVTWQEKAALPDLQAAYQAPNRAHNLRTYFTDTGIRMIPRTGETPEWEWGLQLTGYGYNGQIIPVAPAELKTSGNRIEYHRSDLIEWYVNDQRGLEQGFTLNSPPGRGQGWVFLELALTGNVAPKINADGTALDFFAPSVNNSPLEGGQGGVHSPLEGKMNDSPLEGGQGGVSQSGARVIRYSELHVFDATGKTLPAHFTLHENQSTLSIVVDASEAHYPITVDPLATSPNWMGESNQSGAQFGYSVGTTGDVNGDEYSDVIVGAYYYDNGQVREGRAFVYYGSAIGLSVNPNWTAESNQDYAIFGVSVGTAGDVNGDGYADVIVGARTYDNGQENEGMVFVWYGSATGLGENGTPVNADWTAEGDQDNAYFGCSVGTAGDVNGDEYSDVIIVKDDQDWAFVYHGSTSGLSATANWMAQSGSVAGTAGDVNGDGYSDVIIGDPSYSRAFVYHGSASGLKSTADWTVESDQADTRFGHSVGTAGDVNGDGYSDIIVGEPWYDIYKGRVFVYHGSTTGLDTIAAWTINNIQTDALFGWSVSTAGDVNGDGYSDAIVGAYSYSNGQVREGRAFIYYGSVDGLNLTANWMDESDQSYAQFGWSVSTAGDVNGDGYSDVIVGARAYNNGETGEGAAFVYHGGPDGLSETEGWTVGGVQADGKYGYSVDTAGDVNGDGYADVVVGAPYYDSGQTDEGQVFVYHGDASGLSTSFDWTAEGDQEGAWFGISAGTAGDVNGDGYADLVVGANSYDSDEENTGRTFVYFGSSGGLSGSADWTADGEQSEAGFGYSVGAAGDVNGDGFADIIVGSPTYDNDEVDEGAAFVYHGSPIGLGQQPAWMVESDHENAGFGFSVGTAGDVNGDTYSDVIVGAYVYRRAFVYHGSPAGLSSSEDWWAKEDQGGSQFGFSVSTSGDLNGDGYSDIIVGAPTYSSGESFEGRVYVWYGSGSGLGVADDPADWTAESNVNSAQFGRSVSTAGDVNGDGYSDIIIGAPVYADGEIEEGRAYVWLGSELGLDDPLEPD